MQPHRFDSVMDLGAFRRQDGRERGRLFSIFPGCITPLKQVGGRPREAPRVGDAHEELQSPKPIIHVILT